MFITIRDEPTIEAFAHCSTPQEVRSPDGRLLGQFVPANAQTISFPEFGVTDAELLRRLTDPNEKQHTPEEVMAAPQGNRPMFALIWLTSALDELADIYVAATPDDRARIAAAIDAFNRRVRADPLAEGESRSGGLRIAFVRLVAIVFSVDLQKREVVVLSSKRYGK